MSLDDLEAEECLTLRRFHGGPMQYTQNSYQPDPPLRGVFIDCETTGLDPEVDKIIQLAIVPFTFWPDGTVCASEEAVVFHEDPGTPLSPFISKLTGLTDDDVRDCRIPDVRVFEIIAGAAIIVAHNAEFDRQFLEKRFPTFETMRFGCSQTDVPWLDNGYTSNKLEWLAFKHMGAFFDAHDAATDAYMGIHLLASQVGARSGMSYMLDAARTKWVRLYAVNTPYDSRHVLKARGYIWRNGDDGQPKSWSIDSPMGEALEAECVWLEENVGGRYVEHVTFDSRKRFSARIGR